MSARTHAYHYFRSSQANTSHQHRRCPIMWQGSSRAGILDRPRCSSTDTCAGCPPLTQPPGSNWSLPGCRPGLRRGSSLAMLLHHFGGQETSTPPPKNRMIFVHRGLMEGDVYEVVGHRLDDVEDRPDNTDAVRVQLCHRRRRRTAPGGGH